MATFAPFAVLLMQTFGTKIKGELMNRILITLIGILFIVTQAMAGMPANVLSQVKAKAAQDFPDDYSTQKYVIQTQEQAYTNIQNYRDQRVPQTVFAKLKQKAASDFPLDFSTQKYVLDTQCTAYVQVESYSANGIPVDVLGRVMRKATSDFPNDYSTQKYVIDTQVAAYREMN
jgi:hypothetical protein